MEVIALLLLKTVGSKRAAAKAIWMSLRRVLRGWRETSCGLYIAMYFYFSVLACLIIASLMKMSPINSIAHIGNGT